MDVFITIAERKIREAMQAGMFDNVRTRPLTLPDESWVPEELRAAYRFLKNAGFMPPELQERKEIVGLKQIIDTLDDDTERLRRLRELNFRIMRLNMLRKTTMRLDDECRVIERLMCRTMPCTAKQPEGV